MVTKNNSKVLLKEVILTFIPLRPGQRPLVVGLAVLVLPAVLLHALLLVPHLHQGRHRPGAHRLGLDLGRHHHLLHIRPFIRRWSGALLWGRLQLPVRDAGGGLGSGGGGVVGGRLAAASLIALSETLDLELLCHGEEGVELFLGHVHLAVVHEVEDGQEVGVLHPPQVEEGVGVGVPLQNGPEEGRAGREDHLVGLDLLIVTCQGHIEEVFVFSQLSESSANICLEVVPPQTKLFTSHFDTYFSNFSFRPPMSCIS